MPLELCLGLALGLGLKLGEFGRPRARATGAICAAGPNQAPGYIYIYIYIYSMFAQWALGLSGPRGCWGLKKTRKNTCKPRKRNVLRAPAGSKTHKNTCVSARSDFGLASARKQSKMEKHMNASVFCTLLTLPSFRSPQETRKNRCKQTHLLKTHKTSVFTQFLQMCVIACVFACFPKVPKPKPCNNICF